MVLFVARRVAFLIPTVLGVAFLVFLLLHLVPGDPVRVMVGADVSERAVQELRVKLGLNRPLLVQFGYYLLGLLHGNMGTSLRFDDTVTSLVLARFPATLELAAVSLALSLAAGIPLGVVAAIRSHSVWDAACTTVSLLGAAVPVFWLGILLAYLFGVVLKWLPITGRGGPLWTGTGWAHIVLPAVSLAVTQLAFTTRLVRDRMLEVLGMDYVRSARAKGLSETRVIYHHSLKNAMILIVANTGLQLGYLLGGSVLTETVFVWPGMGRLAVQAISGRDFPVVQGVTLAFAAAFVLINMLVDMCYMWLDPRLRYA